MGHDLAQVAEIIDGARLPGLKPKAAVKFTHWHLSSIAFHSVTTLLL
jgi:hypothetical protein